MFQPSRREALAALDQFVPRAGAAYARNRNYDYGSGKRLNVSLLSPWVRLRLIPEWQLIAKVLEHHSLAQASKFIDEVCWRTYWKGWLSRRPTVWQNYRVRLAEDQADLNRLKRYHNVISAASGIDCMDTWTRELIDTGYLHNHARMWYASIWIHTLQLPWTLGADFFFRHLLDGDPATNTLSWRWVAGCHTEGKAYLANAGNIAHFTEGRFKPNIALAKVPADVSKSDPNPPANPHEALAPLSEFEHVGLLLHEEDLSALAWLREQTTVSVTAGFIPRDSYRRHCIAESVFDFRYQCMRDALDHNEIIHTEIDAIVEWAVSAHLDVVLMAQPAVGIWDELIPELRSALHRESIHLAFRRHGWDEYFYPHAQAGFFRFKKAIPAAIKLFTE